ncbi:MAG: hypothetical protein ABW122_15240, partial [Ilumatobacteraceae bacterium]
MRTLMRAAPTIEQSPHRRTGIRGPGLRGTAVGGVLAALAATAVACGGDDGSSGATSSSTGSAVTVVPGGRCLVRLHGKGGAGGPTTTDGDVTGLAPTGNSDGWGARQWLYFPEDQYDAARAVVAASVDGCGPIIVDGFSNGASFAAALFCRGETFDGRLVRVVVDDPVTDHAVDGCAPDPSVAVTLYATGELEQTAPAGWSCAEADWTCEGGETIGIDAWADALGVPRQQS